jgi:hypothetical protein
MKQTDDKNKWCHIDCALLINGIYFKEPQTRSIIQIPSNLLNIKDQKKQQFDDKNCIYCCSLNKRVIQDGFFNGGVTIKCDFESCKHYFHVTCGKYHKSSLFELVHSNESSNYKIAVHCHEHIKITDNIENKLNSISIKNVNDDSPFLIGTIVKIESSPLSDNYKIMDYKDQLFYEIDFGDGTFSSDMLPEDIIGTSKGIPSPGSHVKVKWNDEEANKLNIYDDCTFLGCNKTFYYTLQKVTQTNSKRQKNLPMGQIIKKSHKDLLSIIENRKLIQQQNLNSPTETETKTKRKLLSNHQNETISTSNTNNKKNINPSPTKRCKVYNQVIKVSQSSPQHTLPTRANMKKSSKSPNKFIIKDNIFNNKKMGNQSDSKYDTSDYDFIDSDDDRQNEDHFYSIESLKASTTSKSIMSRIK